MYFFKPQQLRVSAVTATGSQPRPKTHPGSWVRTDRRPTPTRPLFYFIAPLFAPLFGTTFEVVAASSRT